MSNYINRNIETEVEKIAKQYPVILITGPRQIGKTTLLNYLSKDKNISYVTLDNIEARKLAIEDPKLFLETYPNPVIIDEFQYAPNILSYIKIEIDNLRTKNLDNETNSMYYLTGSQSFLSMKDISESLAGRIGIIDLYGLSLREIENREKHLFIPEIGLLRQMTKPKDIKSTKQLYEIIFKGSFPELYKNENIDIERYYENYVRTYIERDIRELINIKDEIKFMKFMTSIAARTGQEVNASEIANDAEVSVPTVNEWLSILVNTGLVILIEPYSKNIIKRVVKRPKLYFMDTGLASFLTKYPNPEILENSAYSGHIFETYVVSEIVKSFTNNGLNAKRMLYYYRDNHGYEIDLIIEYNNKLYPIEIKKSKSPNKDSIKNFKVLNETDMEIANGTVICMADEIFPIDKGNYIIPIYYI